MGAAKRILVTWAEPSDRSPARPLVLSNAESLDGITLPGAIVIHPSRYGLSATDAATRETRLLTDDRPADIAGWQLSLRDDQDADHSLDLDRSIADQSDVIDPELRIVDGGSTRNGRSRSRTVKLPLDPGSQLVIGRATECDVALTDAKASRRHLRIFVEHRRIYVEDLRSTYGTFDASGACIRGKRLLQHDETLHVGDSRITLIDPLSAFTQAAIGEREPAPAPLRFRTQARGPTRLRDDALLAIRRARDDARSQLDRLARTIRKIPKPSRAFLLVARDAVGAFLIIALLGWCVIEAIQHLDASALVGASR